MPTVHVYLAGKRIVSKEFCSNFYVIKDLARNELFWEADDEQGSSIRAGEIHVWIQRASLAPQISFVRPDWQLVMDGVVMDQAFYTEVDVEGKTIELKHNDYRFVCSFPATTDHPV